MPWRSSSFASHAASFGFVRDCRWAFECFRTHNAHSYVEVLRVYSCMSPFHSLKSSRFPERIDEQFRPTWKFGLAHVFLVIILDLVYFHSFYSIQSNFPSAYGLWLSLDRISWQFKLGASPRLSFAWGFQCKRPDNEQIILSSNSHIQKNFRFKLCHKEFHRFW